MFGIKEGPTKTLRYLVIGVLVCAAVGLAGFLGGRYAAGHQEPPQLSAVVLEGRLAEISELASVTYTYTNMAQFENSDDFYGMKIPFTTKKFILAYDGTIKAGIDLGDVEIEVRDNDVTVTLPEAEILSGMVIHRPEDIEAAAKQISNAYGCAVLLKGGHNINDANDFLYAGGVGTWFHGTRINNPNTHGTGCTLSSAIAANLAKGFDLPASIRRSKAYLSGALGAMLNLGKGRGPMQHNFNLTGEYAKEAE